MTEQCTNSANFRYTWPGRDESYICKMCAPKAHAVAHAIGMHLQIIPLSLDDKRQCQQQLEAASASEQPAEVSGESNPNN